MKYVMIYLSILVCLSCTVEKETKEILWAIDTKYERDQYLYKNQSTQVQIAKDYGGEVDIMGNGGVLLDKKSETFLSSTAFQDSGQWISNWKNFDKSMVLADIEATILHYGQVQNFSQGWEKFEGNPLITESGWHHSGQQTLQLPDSLPGNPADQSLVRGKGKWQGKWLLVFNIDGWGKNGWGMAVADSLAPLKRGENPFRLASPYPIGTGNLGDTIHAPNDWIHVNDTWYTLTESAVILENGNSDVIDDANYSLLKPHLWTGKDIDSWKNTGPIEGFKGHDPGIIYDGKNFHSFNEDNEDLIHCYSKTPAEEWHCSDSVLHVGDHTGDPDVGFFNNRWHMFFDDGPHRHYKIGYAWTSVEKFPEGWSLYNDIFGPHNPEQNQQWDNDTSQGNEFGTGDADIAIEGTTLYMTYEWPVGIAWKEMDFLSKKGINVELQLQSDVDNDQIPDKRTDWIDLTPGTNNNVSFTELKGESFRIKIRMETKNSSESPLINDIQLKFKL